MKIYYDGDGRITGVNGGSGDYVDVPDVFGMNFITGKLDSSLYYVHEGTDGTLSLLRRGERYNQAFGYCARVRSIDSFRVDGDWTKGIQIRIRYSLKKNRFHVWACGLKYVPSGRVLWYFVHEEGEPILLLAAFSCLAEEAMEGVWCVPREYRGAVRVGAFDPITGRPTRSHEVSSAGWGDEVRLDGSFGMISNGFYMWQSLEIID